MVRSFLIPSGVVAPCFDSVSAGCPDGRNDQHPAASRRAAMVRTQGADRCAGYASNSHLIDPAMTPVRGITRLTHCIPCPDARLPLKRQTLVPEPMSYRLSYTLQQTHFGQSSSRLTIAAAKHSASNRASAV